MTRQEILNQFKIDKHGVIRSPGKFEGEMIYVPALWSLVLQGFGYPTIDGRDVIEIESNDPLRKEFPELEGEILVLEINDQGFVHCDQMG